RPSTAPRCRPGRWPWARPVSPGAAPARAVAPPPAAAPRPASVHSVRHRRSPRRSPCQPRYRNLRVTQRCGARKLVDAEDCVRVAGVSDLRVTTRNARFQQWEALLGNRTKRQRTGEFLVHGVRPVTLAVEHGWALSALLYPAGRRLSKWAGELLDT